MKTYYKSRGETLTSRTGETGSTWNTKNKQPVKRTKELNGRAIPYMVTEEIDQAEVTKQWKPQDFALENLMEIGMTGKLPMTMAQLSQLQIIDGLEDGAAQQLDKLEAEAWAQTYLQDKPQETQQNKED